MTHKLFFVFAAFSGAVSVGLGAFGAHALKEKLTQNGYLETYQTAVHYQFIHTVVLLFMGLYAMKISNTLINTSGYLMIIGILIFSGSLYTLSLTGIRWLGAITPLGGLSFIIGWVLLAIHFVKS
jgi:uncharacterized membrane protein YgdD (TMEM256/DUF423 family)